MDKISVIVPVYKVERYLNDCIEGIVGQTYENLEIILIDDGSPDACPDICDKWAEKDCRVKVIHCENGGQGRARNAALDIMSGDYVTFIDSDDRVDPRLINTLYDVLKRDGSDISVCDFVRFDDSEELSFESDPSVPESRILNAFDVLSSGAMYRRSELWGKLYKAEIFKNVRLVTGVPYEDTHAIPYILEKTEKISEFDTVLYYYRNDDSHKSVMNSVISKKKFYIFEMLREHERYYKKRKIKAARTQILSEMVAKTVKASVLCREMKLKGSFYKTFFANFCPVVFAPIGMLGFKERLLYLSSIVPIPAFTRYYKRKLSIALDFEDRNNF
jgi:glycosyltransferase involved in cell wall biosynthesis